jgi:putative sigma-54 modulation protein
MNLIILGSNNFNVSEKTKTYIKKRIEKLNYFKNHINDINFHISEEKHDFKIEATMVLKKQGTHKFSSLDKELYNAIDKLVHKMDIKINREKTKIQDHHSKAGHEDMVDFYYEHDKNMPEPTVSVESDKKEMKLQDALQELKNNKDDFFGFIEKDNGKKESLSFLRQTHEDVVYLLKRKSESAYGEFSLNQNGSINKEIREISIDKLSILDEQKIILDQDDYFNIFINTANNKLALLYKEGNGKWKILE